MSSGSKRASPSKTEPFGKSIEIIKSKLPYVQSHSLTTSQKFSDFCAN